MHLSLGQRLRSSTFNQRFHFLPPSIVFAATVGGSNRETDVVDRNHSIATRDVTHLFYTLQLLTEIRNRTSNWNFNFRVRMFLKGAVMVSHIALFAGENYDNRPVHI